MRSRCLFIALLIFGLWTMDYGLLQATTLDTYFEDFSGFADGAAVDGIDYWKVLQGSSSGAFVQNDIAFMGSAQALEIVGASPDTIVGRASTYYPGLKPMPVLYGGLTPTWVRFRVRPSYAGQTPSLPAHGIAVVCFDYTGRILASNGTTTGPAWVDTGMVYTVGQWYDVALKLNFLSYTYDLYITDALLPGVQFVPIKSGLYFIDYLPDDFQKNTLTAFKFSGAYSPSLSDDVYIDYVSVDYIYRFEFITPPQKLLRGQASGLITMQLQNKLSEVQTTPMAITLDLKSTSLSGRFSLTREPWVDVTQIVMPKFAQEISFYYKDDKAGKPIITVAEYPDHGYVDAIQQLEVSEQPASFEVQVDAKQVAAQEFKIKIIAKDEEGNLNETYGGTVLLSIDYVSPLTGSFNITPDEASGFVRGVAEVFATYPDCGTVSVNAVDKDDFQRVGKSAAVLFLPAEFTVNAEDKQVVARPFNINVTAKNISGQVTPNYNGTVTLYPLPVNPATLSGAAFTPPTITGGQFENGVANAAISYNRYGIIKINGMDSIDNTKMGITGDIQFLPKGISVSVEMPAGRDFFYIEEPIGVLIKILDEAGNAVVNYPGTVSLSSSAGFSIIPDYTFTPEDAGQHKIIAASAKAGTYTVRASIQEGALSGESPVITVKEAYLQVIDTTSPVGTGEVIIQLVDENGNIITSENDLPITVKTEEEFQNNSAYLPAEPVILKDGRAIIPISDTEAETVTIIVSSPFKIKIKKGTVTFGQIGKTGISEQMWRELKEK